MLKSFGSAICLGFLEFLLDVGDHSGCTDWISRVKLSEVTWVNLTRVKAKVGLPPLSVRTLQSLHFHGNTISEVWLGPTHSRIRVRHLDHCI